MNSRFAAVPFLSLAGLTDLAHLFLASDRHFLPRFSESCGAPGFQGWIVLNNQPVHGATILVTQYAMPGSLPC